MGNWEDDLDLDLSDIWAAGTKPANPEENAAAAPPPPEAAEKDEDELAFPSQPENRVLGLENRALGLDGEDGITNLGVTPVLNVDIADAPTQVASQPYVSRGAQLPSFQPLPSPTLAYWDLSDINQQRPSRNREKGPVDIRNYFRGSGSGEGRKRPRIPGPVGDLFRKGQGGEDEDDVVNGDGNAAEDESNDRIFRRGAWICALQSLNVAEFDPAKYAILKMTASNIANLRTQQVAHFVAVIKELTPTVFGDAAVILKDPTGTVSGMMNNKVFSNTDYAKNISPGAAIVLRQVAVFSPSANYLNITISNVVQVFPANTELPSRFGPRQQQQPLPQQEQPRLQPRQDQSFRPQIPSQPVVTAPREQQRSQPPEPQSQPPREERVTQLLEPRSQARPPSPPRESPKGLAAAKEASWDLLSPSPPQSPKAPEEIPESPKAPEELPESPKAPAGIPDAAKMAGWDDMEALLNEGVDDFFA